MKRVFGSKPPLLPKFWGEILKDPPQGGGGVGGQLRNSLIYNIRVQIIRRTQ